MSYSQELFETAKQLIPGGVNSPVRAFRSVGQTPRFIKSANGAYLTDEDSIRYLDYVGSWGPMILGHNHPAVKAAVIKAVEDGLSFGAATKSEVEMAQLICDLIPSVDMVRMVNSGTEAVMSAIRLARGYTGKNKIIKFEGCYHGHSDAMLVKAGSGVMTQGVSDSAGVTEGCAVDTLTVPYNDEDTLSQAFEANKGNIAAVIIEPVAANMGVVLPKDGYLQTVRELCDCYQAILIFDEVITGFRLGISGAQGYFGITPDLSVFGKIIGGGMPVGAYGGKKEIMQMIAPLGTVYQAGTLSGNPIAMAAGLAQLKELRDHPAYYTALETTGKTLFSGIASLAEQYGCALTVNSIGSLGCAFFTDQPVRNYTDAKQSDTAKFADYFRFMLDRDIYLAPSQFEAMFVSAAHTKEEINRTLEAVESYLKQK
ncbi:MAG: glutamate-1-semialdehyde 2,1-aminomutase [Anaerofustis sp.]